MVSTRLKMKGLLSQRLCIIAILSFLDLLLLRVTFNVLLILKRSVRIVMNGLRFATMAIGFREKRMLSLWHAQGKRQANKTGKCLTT